MRKTLLLAGLGLAIALILGGYVSLAEGPVRIVADQPTYTFGEKLSFRLVAESEQEIRSVTLYYRRQQERVTSRVAPQFTPGPHLEATFEKTLEPGEIPPGTTIEYYWRLELADGTRSDTPTQNLICEDDRFAWQTLRADNLTLLYYGDSSDAALAQGLLSTGQHALSRLQAQVGVTLDAPVRVYLYHNTTDMAGALAPRSEGFDQRVVTLGVAVADDTLLLLGSHDGVEQTMAHELSHIVVGLATKNPYAPLPRWLDEGLAMYAEGALPAGNARALEAAVRHDTLISVRSLSGYTGDASQVDLYYGQVYSLVD
ncbi:MAG TPA: peptidase MA family metallohydrolase, partial [Anaerolineae bacterium]|nr:peptidase MA family metallohydrolase [Anaerolineae bacterium]